MGQRLARRNEAMISVFELFKIGVGPSSSHTVGPMKAAAAFAAALAKQNAVDRVESVAVTLLGSLAFTGKGHATDKAVILGLSGYEPEAVDPDAAEALVAEVRETRRLPLAGKAPHRLRPGNRNRLRYPDADAAPPQHAAPRGQGRRRRNARR